MAHSKRHGWTRGPTRVLPEETRKYKVHYRARRRNPDGSFGEWQKGKISMIVETTQEDPEGERAVDRRIRFMREKYSVEIEVFKILDEGDEVPVGGGGVKDGKETVVSSSEYEALRRKQSLITPDHPDWQSILKDPKKLN